MADGSTANGKQARSSRLGWPLTIATGIALFFIVFSFWAFWLHLTQPEGGDFLSFWAAGRLAIEGHASAAYNVASHRAVELTVAQNMGILPFPYPPPFLIFVAPFALAKYPFAYVLWVAATALFYVYAARKFVRAIYAVACPPVLVNLLIGQSGVLIAGLFLLGINLIGTAPLTAGAVLGLLIVKPQMALMLPVAMLAGRHWRAIAGAIASSLTILLVALLLFGTSVYEGFLRMLPNYAQYMQDNRWDWIELASPFAFLRYLGIGESAALAVHGVIAVLAAGLTWIAWSRRWDEKVPILAAATLLASPYFLTYDAVLLIVPAAYLIARNRFWEVGLLWLLAALPVAHFFQLYEGPNTVPLAAMLSLALMSAGHLGKRSKMVEAAA
jgi:hypothetical protein